MMFGSREAFTYLVCAGCRSLRLADMPEDVAAHYPSGYYSIASGPSPVPNRWTRSLRARATDHALGHRSLIGRLLGRRAQVRRWMPRVGAAIRSREDRILDVGCGSGELLSWLWIDGFRNLVGVEPHLPSPVDAPFPIRRELPAGEFDVIMFHHSLEHQADPLQVISEHLRHLAPGGRIVLRFPVADSATFRRYGADWVHLDAPRHVWVPTTVGVEMLAERAGLRIVETWCDPTAFGFWASEMYVADEALYPDGIPRHLPPAGRFSPEVLRRFELLTEQTIAERQGDQAGYVLVRDAATVADPSVECSTAR